MNNSKIRDALIAGSGNTLTLLNLQNSKKHKDKNLINLLTIQLDMQITAAECMDKLIEKAIK